MSLVLCTQITYFVFVDPLKCFEKAAEKCDSDSLGCVVSSSSWGKHAAVGTGSSFQILWNENQVCLSYQPELIAYVSLYQ
jgi:DNA-directed RNA polymerase-5 subunit 1